MKVQPKVRIKSDRPTTTIQSRDMRPSKRLAMRTYLELVDLDTILNSANSCEEKTSLLVLEELATKAAKCLIAG